MEALDINSKTCYNINSHRKEMRHRNVGCNRVDIWISGLNGDRNDNRLDFRSKISQQE